MKTTILKNLKEMLLIQAELNDVITNSKWRKERCDFKLAIALELAEGIDSLAWKWWKKQENDYDNLKVELVDVIHFAFCELLYNSFIKYPNMSDEEVVDNIIKDNFEPVDFVCHVNEGVSEHEKLKKSIDHLKDMLDAYRKDNDTDLDIKYAADMIVKSMHLLFDLGLGYDQLYNNYMVKNVLNIFRNKNGYLDGSYSKMWFLSEKNEQVEDNKVAYLIFEKHLNADSFKESFYKELEELYKKSETFKAINFNI